MTDTQASPEAPPGAVAPWPVEKLRMELVSADSLARQTALSMSVQPGAPVDDCLDALMRCATLVADDPVQLQTVPVALGGATPARMTAPALELISSLLEAKQADPVRIFAAHALFRLKMVPASAYVRLAAMLVHDEANVRQIALVTLSLAIKPATGAITQLVATLPPELWTTEALTALAKSADTSPENKKAVEQHVMRALPAAAIVPTGIAGYTALAQMKPDSAATVVLARIASTATDPQQWKAALAALTTLGESAQSAAAELGRALVSMEDPEREEATCRALVSIRAKEKDVPLARVLARVQAGPDRSTAAHCMLLCLHAKPFATSAKTVRDRYAMASESLKPALSQTHVTLTGIKLGGDPAQRS